MGRKNKTKLMKHGSQSLNASSIGDYDGRSSAEGHVPEFEVLSSHLRELVSNSSPSTNDRHREMKYMFAALEKRDTELMVAKQLIRKLQNGVSSDHNGDGDSSLTVHDETFGDVHQVIINNEELDRAKKQNEDLIEERNTLKIELRNTEEQIHVLEGEIRLLETNLEKTSKSLDEGQRKSAEVFQELESSLQLAEEQADRLRSELEARQSAYINVMNDLNTEKNARVEQEQLMKLHIEAKEEACAELEQALKDLSISKEEVSVLTSTIKEQQNEHSAVLQQLVLDREKLESRYESINNGVQLIKKDFDEVKTTLIKTRDLNKELGQKLAASKADAKHYRDDGDACRIYIKKLEGQLLSTSNSSEKAIRETQEEYRQIKQHLLVAKASVASYEELVKNLSNEFQDDEVLPGNATSVLEAVKKLKESFRLEQRKQVFNLAAVEAKDFAYQKLVQQNKDLLEGIKNKDTACNDELKMLAEEKKKLEEELESSKSFIKKVRKEKDTALKKLKRTLAENSELSDQNKSLEERLDRSLSSTSNESMTSLNSESLGSLEESILLLKATLQSTQESLEQTKIQLLNKEEENDILKQAVVSYESKINQSSQDMVETHKTISTMESRLEELQQSSDELQKRYDEDLFALRQKLESSERISAIQQESSSLKAASEKQSLQKEIDQLNNTIIAHEADSARMKDRFQSAEKEKLELYQESKLLEAQLENVQKTFQEQEKSNKMIKEEMVHLKATLSSSEKQKKESLEELSQLAQKIMEAERSSIEKESSLVEINLKLKAEVDNLQTQIMKQDLEIENLATRIKLQEGELEGLAKLSDQKNHDYEKTLQSEKAKCEILEKKLEEKTTESVQRMVNLNAREGRLEEIKVGFENDSRELKEKIKHLEVELAKAVSEKNAMSSEVSEFKLLIAEKDSNVEKLKEEKSDFDLKQELLEKEIDIVNKKLEEALSPRKDKVLQLENRLEVMQTASKAQYKRLEDELASTRTSLEQSSIENNNLEKQVLELQQKSVLVDELNASNQVISKELAKAVKLNEFVTELEKRNQDIQTENAKERAGLVNELIDTKQKLVECEKVIKELQDKSQPKNSESILVTDVSHTDPEESRLIDEMFPSMDPAVRQLVILLSENRNYSYGVLGLVVYGFLVHLYILFN